MVLPDPEDPPLLLAVAVAVGQGSSGGGYDFVLVSEAQYFGDERDVEVGEFPLFNVMLVHVWRREDAGGDAGAAILAERVAMGRVKKEAWWDAVGRAQPMRGDVGAGWEPAETVVVLL